MAAKTPVSILQEMMAKQGNPPQYDLIYDGSGTHEALFKFKVYADNVIATGSGRSKKEAKHEAAKNALKCLAQYQITSSVEQSSMEGIEVLSPYKDKVQDNAVGSLWDLCVMYEIPMPDYKHIKEEGPPHDRIFTFVCCISKLKEVGVGRTKKQAKQLAANNMLNRLKESLGDIMAAKDMEGKPGEVTEPKSNFKEAINRYISKMGSPKKKVKLNDYPYLYHKTLMTTDEDIVNELKGLRLSVYEDPLKVRQSTDEPPKEDTDADWQETIRAVAEKMQLKLIWSHNVSVTESAMVLTLLQVCTTPEFVFFGTGTSEEKSSKEAAKKCLKFLQIMTHQMENKAPLTTSDGSIQAYEGSTNNSC